MILGIDVGQKNLGVCVWDGTNVQKWAVWNSAGSWAPDIWECLQNNATLEFLEGVTRVVIERQPSKNPSMTRIMHYLEFYFVTRGLPVSLQDSKHKLLFATTTPYFPSTDAEWTYRHRKKLAVQTVSEFIKHTEQPLRDIFESSKKKDDLADALLHAMAYERFSAATPSEKPQKTKKIIARAPTEKQRRTGKLSASNVKYLLQNADDDVPATLKKDPQLARALKKHFGTYETYRSRVT